MAHRTFVTILALALLASPLALPGAQAADPAPVKLMVLGETHGTREVTRDLVGLAVAKGATGCVCPGDFIYGHWDATPGAWRDMMRPLMGNMIAAQGNHDWPWSDWSGIFPDGQRYHARDVNGVQVISLNTEYSLAKGSAQRSWLDARLAEREPGALKVVLMHRPWWLPDGARHPASEFASKNGATGSEMSALMEARGVDLVVSAHEKNHQHSLVRGVHYLVAGGGGHDFYSMGYSLPGAVKRLQANVVTTMDLTPTSLTLKSYTRDWAKVDEWVITGSGTTTPPPPPPPPPGGLSFQPTAGNEWWVQVKVPGASSVDARVDGGAWHALALKSWGDWAASFRVPAGSAVQFQARDASGAAAASGCWRWPDRVAVPCGGGSTTPTYAAAFSNPRGNAWWVEADVAASSLAGVDARVNGGAWVALSKTSWGSWAKSIHAPDGSKVEFRARATDGRAATSGAYAWVP